MVKRKIIEGGGTDMPKMPRFKTDKEAAEWFSKNDTASYMDKLEEVREELEFTQPHPRRKPVGLRLPATTLDAIKKVARKKGIPYQTLIQMWLMEKIREESPDFLP
jgi:predicted DNA binding CopG/RHH family protein